jgi:hypothetical protein
MGLIDILSNHLSSFGIIIVTIFFIVNSSIAYQCNKDNTKIDSTSKWLEYTIFGAVVTLVYESFNMYQLFQATGRIGRVVTI